MKKRDVLVIVTVVAVAAVLMLVLPRLLPGEEKKVFGGSLNNLNPQHSHGQEESSLPVAQAYLRVQVGDTLYSPWPLTQEEDIAINQPDGQQNVVRLTPTSIRMHSANCDNHDCIKQGVVTLENRDLRMLANRIVCLPNQVVLELMDPEEAQRAWDREHAKP